MAGVFDSAAPRKMGAAQSGASLATDWTQQCLAEYAALHGEGGGAPGGAPQASIPTTSKPAPPISDTASAIADKLFGRHSHQDRGLSCSASSKSRHSKAQGISQTRSHKCLYVLRA